MPRVSRYAATRHPFVSNGGTAPRLPRCALAVHRLCTERRVCDTHRCAYSALGHRGATCFYRGAMRGSATVGRSRPVFAKMGARAVPSRYLASTLSARFPRYRESEESALAREPSGSPKGVRCSSNVYWLYAASWGFSIHWPLSRISQTDSTSRSEKTPASSKLAQIP